MEYPVRARLVWWGLDLSQRVWAEPCFEDDGFVIAGVHARTDLVSGLTDDRLGRLASFLWRAPLNGLVRDKVEPTRLQLACSVYVHAETRDWLQQVFGLAAAVQAALANELAGPLAESASLSCAPTFVFVQPAFALEPPALKWFFREALRACGAVELRTGCRSLREHWCKPWDRASDELKRAMGGPPQMKQGEAAAPEESFRDADFDDWWQLVTHPAHVAAELEELPEASAGAIENTPTMAKAIVEIGLIVGSHFERGRDREGGGKGQKPHPNP